MPDRHADEPNSSSRGVEYLCHKKIAADIPWAISSGARFLALQSGNYIHLTPGEEKKVSSYIYQSKRFIKKSNLYNEAVLAISYEQKNVKRKNA